MAQTTRLALFGPILVIATLRILLIMSKHRLNLKIISEYKKKKNYLKKNIPRTQTTRLASFGPILVITNPSCYVEEPALAFIGRRWVLWAFVGLRWPSVGCCGPALAFRGLLWACVGRRWVLWAFVGLRWPSVSCCGPVLAFVGRRWVLWAFVVNKTEKKKLRKHT